MKNRYITDILTIGSIIDVRYNRVPHMPCGMTTNNGYGVQVGTADQIPIAHYCWYKIAARAYRDRIFSSGNPEQRRDMSRF